LLPYTTLFLSLHTHTTPLVTLSLHDALPICPAQGHLRHPYHCASDGASGCAAHPCASEPAGARAGDPPGRDRGAVVGHDYPAVEDRKSTRLNSSHVKISYAVFCLKKKSSEVE